MLEYHYVMKIASTDRIGLTRRRLPRRIDLAAHRGDGAGFGVSIDVWMLPN